MHGSRRLTCVQFSKIMDNFLWLSPHDSTTVVERAHSLATARRYSTCVDRERRIAIPLRLLHGLDSAQISVVELFQAPDCLLIPQLFLLHGIMQVVQKVRHRRTYRCGLPVQLAPSTVSLTKALARSVPM
ncbi:hypothetical protein FE257_002326 [Aspergillus nanangensis]|uniref:Uncharacterized protein n=1 Tax=Aspergillus nanangensis TaxID=2582783 RepID=A0AAD4GP56_ASPNN|nr:hypothetical protein FE257_002326 [Aspergillus nanangensis]